MAKQILKENWFLDELWIFFGTSQYILYAEEVKNNQFNKKCILEN